MGRFHLEAHNYFQWVYVNSLLVDNLFHRYKRETYIVLLASHCESGGNACPTSTYFLIY